MHKEHGTSGGSKPVRIGDLCMGLISCLQCLQPLQPGPIIINDQEEYEVEEVLDSRFRWGKLWYLVKLIGWSHSDNMWLPHSEVHALAVVEEFHLQHPDSPCSSSPSTPTASCHPQHQRRATPLRDVAA